MQVITTAAAGAVVRTRRNKALLLVFATFPYSSVLQSFAELTLLIIDWQ